MYIYKLYNPARTCSTPSPCAASAIIMTVTINHTLTSTIAIICIYCLIYLLVIIIHILLVIYVFKLLSMYLFIIYDQLFINTAVTIISIKYLFISRYPFEGHVRRRVPAPPLPRDGRRRLGHDNLDGADLNK